ncbi:MAG TPA: hypothetical protein VEB43_21550 [Anaeromyxobacter sp.]|nr:hypothetical protein [Anaeromyxobacter sp.]
MSRKQKAAAVPSRLEALLGSGDHRAAAREAGAILADGAATPEQRARARAALGSLTPEPLAVAFGLAGVAVAVALSVWVALGGAR